MRYLTAIVVVLAVCAASSVPAAELLVPSQYASIQQAIDASSDGDTVIVAPGLYYERINFNGKNIVVTSTDPTDSRVVGYTILNAEGEGSVVTFENRETSAAVLTGFTLTGGAGTLTYDSDTYKIYYGAGIYCVGASPTITHNVITNNVGAYRNEEIRVDYGGGYYYTYAYTYTYGGGIYYGGHATVSHNTIYNNSGYVGGGIYSSGSATVTNNLIYNNSAYYGGGIYASSGRVRNNTFVGNDTSLDVEYGQGGNVYAYFGYDYTRLIVSNNVICGAGSGGGLFASGAGGDVIRFNNVWDNEPANYGAEDLRSYDAIYGDTADWTGRHGNISEDPVFASSWSQRYRLDAGSPCISAGDPNFVPDADATDLDGDPRIYAVRVDIGADEYIGYVRPLADAGADQHVLSPEPLTLDGTESYFHEPEGAKAYQWLQTDGASVELDDSTAARPTFTPPGEGWYRFALVVTDDSNSSLPDEVLVVVGNERPVANAGADKLWGSPGWVALDGSDSSDADPPDELIYTWTQIDGPPVDLNEPASATPYFECQEAGVYTFELVVSDGFVDSEADRVKLEASPFTLNVESSVVIDRDMEQYYVPAVSGTGIVSLLRDEEYDWQICWIDAETGEVQIFDGGAVEAKPQVDGDLIVWAAGSGYYYQPSVTSVYLADLVTGEQTRLERGSGRQSCGYPMVSGNKVVWLRHHDVDTDDEDSYDNSPYDVCGADLSDRSNPVYFTVAEATGHGRPYPHEDYYSINEGYVDVCGDIVVWESDGDIYGADLSDLENITVFAICTAPERQYDPVISGDLVVWTDERNDIGDIYAADISDRNNVREFPVWVEPGWQAQPDVDGALIICCNGGNDTGYFQTCCVSREYGLVEFVLPDRPYGSNPDVDGGTITWEYNGQANRMTLDFGYGLTAGPVENQTTGWRYDYLQHAIAAAEDGDVIVAEPGTYREKLRVGGKNITVTSTDPEDPTVRGATVLTGEGPLVIFDDDATTDDCFFTGFTVTGGSFGIVCNGASPTISHCDLSGNRDAGIKLWGESEPTVSYCEINGNGIGVEMWAQTGTRYVLDNGGTLRNCVITGNRSYGVLGGEPTVSNCTVADNLGYGLWCSSLALDNSIVYFNNGGGENVAGRKSLTVTYSDVQGGASGAGNIDGDPLFVARGGWTEAGWVPGDYHLQSQGWSWDSLQGDWSWDEATSPCIDAGNPSATLGDEPPCETGDPLSERATNSRLNMGAYGGTSEASLAPR